MLIRARALLVALAVAIPGAAAPSVAHAHQLDRNYCDVRTVLGGIDVTVQTPVKSLLAWDEPEGPAAEAKLLARSTEFAQSVVGAVTAASEEGACDSHADPATITAHASGRVLNVPLHFRCPSGAVTLHNAWRLDTSPYSEVLCAVDGTAVSFRPGHEDFLVGTPPSAWASFKRFLGSGTSHVLSGLDHVLFLVTLLLASVLPSERLLKKKLISTLQLVTGFTVGHSITLIAASTGALQIAPRISETLIALSIVVVGLENVLRATIRARVATVSLFGLVHGLGFAGALRELVPHDQSAVYALFGFNVGVEFGQLAVVSVLWPVLVWAAAQHWYRRSLLVPISLSVSALAMVWSIKRAAGLTFWPWLGA
jgi:HupE/UreJ protein